MGEAAITWEAMAAWTQHTGIELDAWEARTIRRLSATYLSQRHDAVKPDCPEPYADEAKPDMEPDDPVSRQFKAMMAG